MNYTQFALYTIVGLLLVAVGYQNTVAFQYRRAYERAIEHSESLSRTYGNRANNAFTCRLTTSIGVDTLR